MLATNQRSPYIAAWVESSSQLQQADCYVAEQYPNGGEFKYHELYTEAAAIRQQHEVLKDSVKLKQNFSMLFMTVLQKQYAAGGFSGITFVQNVKWAREQELMQQQAVDAQEQALATRVQSFERRVGYLLDDLLEKEFDLNAVSTNSSGQLSSKMPFAKRFDGVFREIDNLLNIMPPSPMLNYYRHRRLQKEQNALRKYRQSSTREEVTKQSLNQRFLQTVLDLRDFVREKYQNCFKHQTKMYEEVKPSVDESKAVKADGHGDNTALRDSVKVQLIQCIADGDPLAISALSGLASEYALDEGDIDNIRKAAAQGFPMANVQLAQYGLSQQSGTDRLQSVEIDAIERVVRFAKQDGLVAAIDLLDSIQSTAKSIKKALNKNGDPIEGDHRLVIGKAMEGAAVVTACLTDMNRASHQIVPPGEVELEKSTLLNRQEEPAWLRSGQGQWPKDCARQAGDDIAVTNPHDHVGSVAVNSVS